MPDVVELLSPLDAPTLIAGVLDDEYRSVRALWKTWKDKLPRNQVRTAYYDGVAPIKDLGIAIPPALSRLEVVMGWPEKAVRSLATRNIWDGFVAAGQDVDPFGLGSLLEDNRFDVELPQAIVSAYKHSCSFVSTTLGDVASGEPEVLVMARSAEWSAALWDRNKRSLSAYLGITDTDGDGRPTGFFVVLPDVVLICVKSAGGAWSADRRPNPLKQILVEALTYDPQLDRPFGRSRITRAVMNITDRAARTVLRQEVSAEFYTSPQRYVLGGEEGAWAGTDKWKATMGRILALTRDEDGELPTVGQFPQMTMQPHSDMLRQLAAQFAGETGVPLNSLGVVQDNPSSADAIYAAKEDLIVDALAQNRVFGSAISRIGQRAVMLRDGLTEPTQELRKLRTRWANPAFPSPVSAADALVKISAVFPWLGDSDVALERAGFSDTEILRLVSDRKRAQSSALLTALGDGAAVPADAPDPTAELKDQILSLGTLIRSGVTPESAATAVGITGLVFRDDAVPVTLRSAND